MHRVLHGQTKLCGDFRGESRVICPAQVSVSKNNDSVLMGLNLLGFYHARDRLLKLLQYKNKNKEVAS